MLWNKHWQEVESGFYAWNGQLKKNILHLWSFPQEQGFPFVTVFSSHYLFNLPEWTQNLLITWKEKQSCCWDERLIDTAGEPGAPVCALTTFSLPVKNSHFTQEGSQVSCSKLPWVRLSSPPGSSEPVGSNTKQVRSNTKHTAGGYRTY